MRTRTALAHTAAAVAVTLSCGTLARAQSATNPGHPAPECRGTFGDFPDRLVTQGYIAQWSSGEVCIPFAPTDYLMPENTSWEDYYIGEFSYTRISELWEECKQDEACAQKFRDAAMRSTRPANRNTGKVDSLGAIDPHGMVNLAEIRRPAYFGSMRELEGQAVQFDEPIAAAESSTYTVEFTAPPDGYERAHMGLSDPIKLRGWYMQGAGIDDGAGGKVRSMIIFNGGGGAQFTSLGHPWWELDAATGTYVHREHDLPQESNSMVAWRDFAHDFHAAGFDVLITDRRGDGISGGMVGYNNLVEQANDIFLMLSQLDSGEGLRILTPEGEELAGAAAARVPLGGLSPYEVPSVVLGYSRGSYAAQWFMHKNFAENCNYGPEGRTCAEAVGLENVRGAIIMGGNLGGLGWRFIANQDYIREAVMRNELYIPQLNDSEVLANVNTWPAVQILKGTYDEVESLEGTLAAYRRFDGLKDISVFAGQHGLTRHTPAIMDYMSGRMIAFARAAVLGHDAVEGSHEPTDLRDLVLSSPELWEFRVPMDEWERF